MDEQEFKKRADRAMTLLNRALAGASDDYSFNVEFRGGALTIKFEYPPGKLVITPNVAAHQIWISAPSGSYKLDWDIVENAFVLTETGQTMKQLAEQVIGRQVRQEVTL